MTERKAKMPKIGRPRFNPEAGPMRNRSIRCDDPVWDAAVAKAAEDETNISAVIRHYLTEYAKA